VTHLTNSDVEAYWGQRLAAADLMAVDRHVAECPGCQEVLMAAAPAASFDVEPASGGHLEYEEIEEYASGPGAGKHAAADAHLAQCERCRAEVEDLRRFVLERRSRNQPEPRTRGANRSAIAQWWRWAAVGGLAAGIGLVLMLPQFRPGLQRRAVSQNSTGAVRTLLMDGGRAVGLDARGGVRGLPDLPQTEGAVLAVLLAGGGLPLASAPAELKENGGPQRAMRETTAEFAPVEPLGRVTLDDQPVFRWSALAGARAYRVRVFDPGYRLIAESALLAGTEWRPEKALARGQVYSWQVTGMRGEAEVPAPRPPASEARFAVLDRVRADRLTAALMRTPVSHLALSALYAEAGMSVECLRELDALQAENPGSALVARLRLQMVH
jgi:hypothetical protein